MQSAQTLSDGFLNPETIIGDFGVTPGMQIADFGSGSGHVAILLGKRAGEAGKVTAIDIMEDKLDSVRVQAKEAGVKNIETVRADLEVSGGTGIADNSQDLVVLVNILFQSQKKSDILKEAKRVLKMGGRVVVVDWKKSTQGFGPPDLFRSDEGAMQALFTNVGFSFVKNFNTDRYHYGLIFQKP